MTEAYRIPPGFSGRLIRNFERWKGAGLMAQQKAAQEAGQLGSDGLVRSDAARQDDLVTPTDVAPEPGDQLVVNLPPAAREPQPVGAVAGTGHSSGEATA